MRLNQFILSFLFIVSYSANSTAQFLDLQPKFFTLRNARLSFGINGSINWADGETSTTFMNKFIGKLPNNEFEIKFDTTQGLPYATVGVLFDLFAPNSALGFAFGCEWNKITFQIHDEFNNTSLFNIQRVQIPLYLKCKFGKIHSKTNGLFLIGGVYSLPYKYSRQNEISSSKSIDELKNTISFSSWLGLQFRFTKKERIEKEKVNGYVKNEYTRSWLFIRADMLQVNFFNPNNSEEILPLYSNDEIDYRDINFTLGLAIFLGYK